MKYSRNKINQVGQTLMSEVADVLEKAEAVTIVDNWREDHMPVLSDLIEQVSALFARQGIDIAFSSLRLKRMTSIIDKLKHNPDMRLGGVQDIGGARFVFADVQTLFRAKDALASASFDRFTLDRSAYDYISNPKESGYRSIHFVYKYHSDDDSFDGKRVELQIRTKLQHDWATAVETAELISRSSLKAGKGDEEWMAFFRMVSAIFARMEGLPVHSRFERYDEADYCREYAAMDKKRNFLDKLQALAGAVSMAETQSFRGGYVILFISYEDRRVNIRHFSSEKMDQANELYAQVESTIERELGAVVLVSVSGLNELREAYPGYFLNAQEFVGSLTGFMNQCRIKGFIK